MLCCALLLLIYKGSVIDRKRYLDSCMIDNIQVEIFMINNVILQWLFCYLKMCT